MISSEDDVPDLVLATNATFLSSAIFDYDINLITELFTISNVTDDHLYDIVNKPELYETLEYLLHHNEELCKFICKIINTKIIDYISRNITVELLNICITYISSDRLLQNIFDCAIYKGNLLILDTLFATDYDIKLAFSKSPFSKNIENL